MDSRDARELQSHHCRTDDPLDGKQLMNLGANFFRLHPKRQVPSKEQHLFANLRVWSWQTKLLAEAE